MAPVLIVPLLSSDVKSNNSHSPIGDSVHYFFSDSTSVLIHYAHLIINLCLMTQNNLSVGVAQALDMCDADLRNTNEVVRKAAKQITVEQMIAMEAAKHVGQLPL